MGEELGGSRQGEVPLAAVFADCSRVWSDRCKSLPLVPEAAEKGGLFWVVLGCSAVEISEDVK